MHGITQARVAVLKKPVARPAQQLKQLLHAGNEIKRCRITGGLVADDRERNDAGRRDRRHDRASLVDRKPCDLDQDFARNGGGARGTPRENRRACGNCG